MSGALRGKVALVAGGTRGASRAIAVELGRAGATVYVTGRTTRTERSEVDRPESIEDTAELVAAAGGEAVPIRVDHLDPARVKALAERIDADHGRLDVLVDGVWGGDHYIEWGKPVWEHSLEGALRQIRLGIDAHVITSHHLLPLLIRRPGGLVVEMTDGTAEYNARFRKGTSLSFYVAKTAAHHLAIAQAEELRPHGGVAVAMTPGWLRSEAMLEIYGVTEENWRDALVKEPHFGISESPTFVGRTVAALAADPDAARFTGQTLSSGQLAKIYDVDDVDGSRPDGWRYLVEVQDAGKPADPTGYR
ncbi:NAD(P)-dependent dehydrogenase, short-chain alcohol dehydrogenase family [Amycolatopsis arida]|uniref:NAD(P)-dependent dehydrogenase, short-chain alcohol dehydrogenase family n=1 Tax=Amycolatopsis arida TaxID=587909 RepID=A0A1I5S885_9PSEU|nr:SDR family oxidoreductase [Amycolatopsis arida]TDX85317.1 NAD(P)-dependent dehydrogenase (short-subunit alcohol dehydrogenase family) [Amycolatopsis arida]SFP66944.1 NAD(P)-dependent dehydrogenase, short-chain alcohol dehydrogenase family [Amycolatopsis arida]